MRCENKYKIGLYVHIKYLERRNNKQHLVTNYWLNKANLNRGIKAMPVKNTEAEVLVYFYVKKIRNWNIDFGE